MNINASIVDQRLNGILADHANLLPAGLNEEKQRSVAFVLLSIATMLDFSLKDASELLTEGGQDEGVDGLHLGEVEDGEFTVTLFQGKYKHKDLGGTANFPENGVQKAIATISGLFDPSRELAKPALGAACRGNPLADPGRLYSHGTHRAMQQRRQMEGGCPVTNRPVRLSGGPGNLDAFQSRCHHRRIAAPEIG